MNFCCGASMIGARGTVKHFRTSIHNVPLVFCPVCHRYEVHHSIIKEFELIAEYAHGDGVLEVDFLDYTDIKEDIYDDCVSNENDNENKLIQDQIDMSLDLLLVAKQLADQEWETQLKHRLAALHRKQQQFRERKSAPPSL